MEKPHLSKFVFEAFDPVHEAGKQARWYGVLAEFQKGSDGVYRKVLSGELTLAQLEAQGFVGGQIHSYAVAEAMRRAEAAEAQITALQNEVTQARAERDRAVTRAAEQALDYGKHLNAASETIQQWQKQCKKLSEDLGFALGARDNFAALEKKARGELISLTAVHGKLCDGKYEAEHKLNKIPRLIRRAFGAI